MASTTNTKTLLKVYEQEMTNPLLFFSGFFRSPKSNFYNTKEIEIDVVRGEEEVSIAIQDISQGYRKNSANLYTSKGFIPPVHKESLPIDSHELMNRMPGNDPFKSVDFRANLVQKALKGAGKMERKIRRSIELQCSQVLQTGIATLIDSDGNQIYQMDYKPKAAHFPTAGVSWATATGAQKLAGLSVIAELIRSNGLAVPDELHFGIDAWDNFIADDDVRKMFDNRRIDQGRVSSMEIRGNGGTFRGVVEIGNYKFDIWTYGGKYTHPQTGESTFYLDPGKVIVRASSGRMDLTFGGIPNIGKLLGKTGPSVLSALPGRLASSKTGIDLFTNAWLTADGEQLVVGIGARPLAIPTAIDTFGCLDTQL